MSDHSEQDLPWIGPGRYRQDDTLDQVKAVIYRGPCNLEQEIVDEFVRMRAVETCPGRVCSRACTKTCRAQCYSNDMSGSCAAVLCLLIIGCVLFLTFFAILSMVPRVTSTLERTTGCTVVRFHYEDFDKVSEGECACHIRCPDTPIFTDYCVKLLVQYTNDEGRPSVRTLPRTETAMQCTPDNYPHCPGDVHADSYPYMVIGSSFLCLVHPELLITDIFDVRSLIHICWPVVVILVSLTWLICMCSSCGCEYISVHDYPPHVKAIADGLGRKGIFTILNLSEADRAMIVREWKTVRVRVVGDGDEEGEEGDKTQGLEQEGVAVAAAGVNLQHEEAVAQVQVHQQQQPHVHQAQVYPPQPSSTPMVQLPSGGVHQPGQVSQQQERPPAYAPPAYEGLSHDQTPTTSASQKAVRVNAHAPQVVEEAGTRVPGRQVSHDEEEQEEDEHHTLEDQPGQHLSQEQVSDSDLSTEDTGVLSQDSVVSHDELHLDGGEGSMGQGHIELPRDNVPGHEYSESTNL